MTCRCWVARELVEVVACRFDIDHAIRDLGPVASPAPELWGELSVLKESWRCALLAVRASWFEHRNIISRETTRRVPADGTPPARSGAATLAAWTGDSRGLRLGRVIVPVCPGAVFFNVLPSPGVKTVGPGVVRAVVALLVTLTADQAAVRRGDDRAGRVRRKVGMDITRRQGLGGDRLSCLESG